MRYKPMPTLTPEQIARFWSHVDIRGEDDCWLWTACSKNGHGYGDTSFFGSHYSAHRIAYWLASGEDPGPLQVCHTCDNPPCCNPGHHFLGTNKDNADDCTEKGRQNPAPRPGSTNHGAKITESDAIDIYISKATCRALADQYGISDMVVSLIKRGKRWSHATWAIGPRL